MTRSDPIYTLYCYLGHFSEDFQLVHFIAVVAHSETEHVPEWYPQYYKGKGYLLWFPGFYSLGTRLKVTRAKVWVGLGRCSQCTPLDKRRCLAGTIETKSCKMLLFKRFKCLFVAFLLLSAYQFMNGNNQGALMCVPCCTITLIAMILLLSFIVTHSYVAIHIWITTSGYMCRFLERLLVASVIIGTCTLIDSLLDDSSSQVVFHHEGIWNTTSSTSSIPITFVGGR